MKIAFLGGSFNPIHTGHLVLADEVCCSLGYDRVLFVPAGNPPHKEMTCGISTADRLEMVRLACLGDERFVPESCEIDRGGISYTYDTICWLEKKYAGILEGKIGLIIGRDLFSGFRHWHRAGEIAQKCQLILAERPYSKISSEGNRPVGKYSSVDHEKDAEFDTATEALFSGAKILANPPIDISSSEIRMKAASSGAFRYLVPDAVFKYIVERNIYGSE